VTKRLDQVAGGAEQLDSLALGKPGSNPSSSVPNRVASDVLGDDFSLDHGTYRLPSGETDVLVVESPSELHAHLGQWEDLSASVIEPNVFYEPWLLLPAIESLAKDKKLRFVLVFVKPHDTKLPPLLTGFFPLELRGRYRGLPVPVSSMWRHIHCFLCMPLVRRGYARETLRAFFDWSQSASGALGILEFPWIPKEGPLASILQEVMDERGVRSLVVEEFSRGFVNAAGGFDRYLDEAISGKGRRELKRRERLLDAFGPLEYRRLERPQEPGTWIDEFLAIEAGGWKGRERTAIACNNAESSFFIRVLDQAFRKDRLLMISLRLAGSAIAMQCGFLSSDGCFAFKTAYDERYSHYSPGVLLQIETIRQLHDSTSISWLDSCAAPDSTAVNRVCRERRKLQTLLASTGGVAGRLLVSSLPLVRSLKRKIAHHGSRAKGPAGPGAGTGQFKIALRNEGPPNGPKRYAGSVCSQGDGPDEVEA
jgi:hypothetical protein